jgi:hypothetical protein
MGRTGGMKPTLEQLSEEESPGAAHYLEDQEERTAVAAGIDPWAGGDKDVYIRIRPALVTGRRIKRG